MGLIANEKRYIDAIKELYPRGKFFEDEFSNFESDLSKIVEVKGKELYNFKKKIQNLWNEAILDTCSNKTIADYERTITGIIRNDLSLDERKTVLKQYQYGKLDLSMLEGIAKIYNAKILKVEYPYLPSLFGLSRFGRTRIINYKAFNVIYVYAILNENANKEKFEEGINKIMFADKLIYFKYENVILKEGEQIYVDVS